MHQHTTTISVPALEDIIAHILDADSKLRCLHTQMIQVAITDADAEGLATLTEARRQLETARRRLAAAHPNKEERR